MATTQLDTFSTAGAFTYTIPTWAHRIDVIVLGGGRGGRQGGAGFANGGGGDSGKYASATIIRGTTIGWGVTSVTGTVGAGGAGGGNPGGNGVASTATATGWAGITGAGGATDFQGTSATGAAAGNLTFNSNTYVGGAAQATLGNIGNAPGGGGSGGQGNFASGNPGGAGAVGRVWIFAYGQFADAPRSIAVALTSAGLRRTFAAIEVFGTTERVAVMALGAGLQATRPITATLTSVGLRNVPSSVTQSETATTTSAGLRNAIVNGPAPIAASLSSALRQADIRQASLSVTATLSPSGKIAAPLSSLRSTSVSVTANSRWAALFSASRAIDFSYPTIALRNIPTAISLPVVVDDGNTAAKASMFLSSSTLIADSVSSSVRLLADGDAPSNISFVATTDSLRLAKVNVAQAITATRNSIVRWDADFNTSRAITAASTSVAKNSTVINATTLPGFPYELPLRFGVTFTATLSGFITRLQYADVPRAITAGRTATAVGVLGIYPSLAASGAGTATLNSNQPTQTTTLAITTNRSSTALRKVFASASLPVTVTASSANVFAGFVDTVIDVVITDSTSATEILLAVTGSGSAITANRPAAALRNARTGAALTVTANRASNVKWDADFASFATAITVTRSSYAVYSTDIVTTTLPGFPYEFPMRFGTTFSVGIASSAANRFTAPTLPTAVVAAISAVPKAGWSATPSLSVTLSRSQNANIDTDISSSTTTSASSVPATRKNLFIAAINTAITGSIGGSSLSADLYEDSSLAVSLTRTTTGRLDTFISSQTSTSATSSLSSLRTVRVAPSLLVSGTLSAVANYRTTASSSLLIDSDQAANLNESTVINATTLPGFPYELPYRFGVTFKASTPSSAGISQKISASLYAFFVSNPNVSARWATSSLLPISFVTNYAGFPYELPFLIGRLNTKANTSATPAADNTLINAATGSAAKTNRVLSGVLGIASAISVAAQRDARVQANTLITAETDADELQNTAYFGSASLVVNAGRNSVAANRIPISGSLSASFVTDYPGFPYTLPYLLGRLNTQANVYNGISSSTPINVLVSASAKQNFSASVSRQITVLTSASAVDSETMSAHLNAKASLVPCFPYDLPIPLSSAINAQASMSRNQKFDVELQVISDRETKLGHSVRAATSLVVSFVTDYQGMPYTLPFLLGKLNTSAVLKKSIQASFGATATIPSALSLGQSLSAAKEVTATRQAAASHGIPIYAHLTVKNAIVPCFPYDLPIVLSSEPNARASALRDARVNASLVTNVGRPTNIGILVKGDVSLTISAATNYQTFPYTLPYLLGRLDTRASLSRSIQSSLSGLATRTASASQNQNLSANRQITALLSASGSRDALVSASLRVRTTTVPCFPYVLPFELNTVSYQQASASRLTSASVNTVAVGVRGMDPTFMPGFPYVLPFKIGTAPSPRMILGTKSSSSTSIITALDVDMDRKLGGFSAKAITATTEASLSGKLTVATHLAVGPAQTPVLNVFPYELPYQFATYRSEPPRATLVVSARVTSTTLAITARTYGFPYQLPIILGPVNSVRLSRSISAQTNTSVATSASAENITGAIFTNLLVSVGNPSSAKSRLYAYVNSRPGFPYTLPLLLRKPSFDITANRPTVLGFVRFASAQFGATVNTGNPSTLARYSANPAALIIARPTANANFVAAISSSLAATVILTALGKYRIRLAAALTASPISFVRMNFRTRISTPLSVQSDPAANATFDTVLSAPLLISTAASAILSEVSNNSAILSSSATVSVSGLRDTKASANTNVSATFGASMFLAAQASGPLPVTVSADVRTREYGLAFASLEIASSPVANLLQRSAISAPSDISFNTNTVQNQYQRFSTTVSSLASLLAVVSKDQKIGSPTSTTLAGIFSSILRSVTATAQPVIVASRPTAFHGDFFCGTEMGITAQPSIWFSWAAHADIPLDVTAGLDISIRRGQFIVSVGTAVSAEVTAKAEPYRAAGTFLPFFYAGSNFV